MCNIEFRTPNLQLLNLKIVTTSSTHVSEFRDRNVNRLSLTNNQKKDYVEGYIYRNKIRKKSNDLLIAIGNH